MQGQAPRQHIWNLRRPSGELIPPGRYVVRATFGVGTLHEEVIRPLDREFEVTAGDPRVGTAQVRDVLHDGAYGITFRNVWRRAARRDLRLCGQGLLIRDEQGKTVYDNKPEGVACTTDLRPTTVAPGGVHVEPWGRLPALKAGWYTAILWGEAVKRFEVKP